MVISRGSWWLAGLALLGCAGDAAPEDRAETAAEPVYERDVAPLLRAQCTGCHRDDGVAPFALDSFARAAARADEIARVTRARRMPPWPAQGGDDCPTLVGARGLEEREIAVLETWARAGAPRGERASDADGGAGPAQRVETLEHVDAVLQPSEPYLPRPMVDDHRCFVLDPGLDADRYLTAYAVRQGVPGIVHHVQLWAVDDEATELALDALDAADPGSGYGCPEGHQVAARYVSVWAPSEPVRRHPPGTGMLLHAGRRMVIQIHYNDRQGLGLPDRTAIELELADEVERPASMWVVTPPDILLPPGLASTTVRADFTVPPQQPVQLWGVRPHMHTLGSSAEIRLLGSAGEQCLLSVPRWDPAWQLMYFYESPVTLGGGEQLEVDCSYDTRTQTEAVRYGIRTVDEMCFGFFYVTGG